MGVEEGIYIDKLREVIRKIEAQVQSEFKRGAPYVVISTRRIRRELGSIRGIPFIVRFLSRRYEVIKDGNWLIIRPKKRISESFLSEF